MTWQELVFIASIMVYAVAARVYVGLAVIRTRISCRIFFVLRLLAFIAVLMAGFEARPTAVAICGAVYVFSAVWSWRRQSIEELRAGAKARGAATAFARKIAA